MGALYSHTTRSTGTTLTAVIYNADHQNHIDNGIPTQLDDYSANAAQMQSTTNPGEAGSESLATSLAGEIERIRFILAEIKGNPTQWYTSGWEIGSGLLDANGNELLKLAKVGSAVNEVTITNAATGNGPLIQASGETNVPLRIASKGTGHLQLEANGAEALRLDSTQRAVFGNATSSSIGGEATRLQVQGSAGQNSDISAQGFSADAVAPGLLLGKSRHASVGSHTVVQANDGLGRVEFYGSDGTNFELAAYIFAAVDATPGNNDMPGRLTFLTTPDGSTTPSEAMRIDRNQLVGIGNTDPTSVNGQLVVDAASTRHSASFRQTDAANNTVIVNHLTAAQTATTLSIGSNTAAGTGFSFCTMRSDIDGTPDTEFSFRGDGQGFQDAGTAWSTPADYAEMFETVDGKDLPVGHTVVLVEDKVRAATPLDKADDVIGVVRPRSGVGSIIANAGDLRWNGKYLHDENDEYEMEDYKVYEWEETVQGQKVKHNHADYKMPKGVVPPTDAKVTTFKKRKLNPAFNPDVPYVPRRERPEWVVVGLVGQVKVKAGQPTNPRWRKMRGEKWFIR